MNKIEVYVVNIEQFIGFLFHSFLFAVIEFHFPLLAYHPNPARGFFCLR
jgi:hypothetical protein